METSDDVPTFGARRADALLRLLDGANPDTEIVVHVASETLGDDTAPGCCELEHGPAVPPETARRLACDAGVVRLVEDADGQPLDVGRRTRSIPPALRCALNAHDGGCRFPGCDTRAHVQGHHVQHWAHGGTTAFENLVFLCRHHHRLVHEGGFGGVHRRDGVFHFHRRDGTVLKDTQPRVVAEGCPQQRLMHANRERRLAIDAHTGVALEDGVRSKWRAARVTRFSGNARPKSREDRNASVPRSLARQSINRGPINIEVFSQASFPLERHPRIGCEVMVRRSTE